METRAPQGFAPLASVVEPKPRQNANPTDLPKEKSVAAAEKAEQAKIARQSDAEEREEKVAERVVMPEALSETEVMTHKATGSMVLQIRDLSSGEVINQFPNNATLKQRAMEKYAAVQGASTIRRTV
ncbi:MAG: flagellar protein FlaG [Devosiaceae bacterium]|nr:flagellar protein FlaG [Devosiaceae bacterium MH13]